MGQRGYGVGRNPVYCRKDRSNHGDAHCRSVTGPNPKLPAGDTPDEALHRNSFEILKRQRRSGTLSRQFSEILGAAGLRDVVSHKAAKRALDGDSRRKVNELSFHSLRHTAVSLLKKAGVGEAIAMDLVGHDSVAISRHYTHVDFNTKSVAINKLPKL